MIRYLLVMAMIILTPPKGSGGMPLAPKPAVIEARVWDRLAAALSFVESRNDDRAYNASSGALGRHGYEWIRRMRKFENKADRHTFQKVFGNKRGNELWDCFLEVGKSIFILEDSYFLINDRNVFSLCLAECSDYDLYELVHNIETDSDQGK